MIKRRFFQYSNFPVYVSFLAEGNGQFVFTLKRKKVWKNDNLDRYLDSCIPLKTRVLKKPEVESSESETLWLAIICMTPKYLAKIIYTK